MPAGLAPPVQWERRHLSDCRHLALCEHKLAATGALAGPRTSWNIPRRRTAAATSSSVGGRIGALLAGLLGGITCAHDPTTLQGQTSTLIRPGDDSSRAVIAGWPRLEPLGRLRRRLLERLLRKSNPRPARLRRGPPPGEQPPELRGVVRAERRLAPWRSGAAGRAKRTAGQRARNSLALVGLGAPRAPRPAAPRGGCAAQLAWPVQIRVHLREQVRPLAPRHGLELFIRDVRGAGLEAEVHRGPPGVGRAGQRGRAQAGGLLRRRARGGKGRAGERRRVSGGGGGSVSGGWDGEARLLNRRVDSCISAGYTQEGSG